MHPKSFQKSFEFFNQLLHHVSSKDYIIYLDLWVCSFKQACCYIHEGMPTTDEPHGLSSVHIQPAFKQDPKQVFINSWDSYLVVARLEVSYHPTLVRRINGGHHLQGCAKCRVLHFHCLVQSSSGSDKAKGCLCCILWHPVARGYKSAFFNTPSLKVSWKLCSCVSYSVTGFSLPS